MHLHEADVRPIMLCRVHRENRVSCFPSFNDVASERVTRALLTVSFGQRSCKPGSCHEWEIGQKGKQRKKNSVKWIESIAYLVCFLFAALLVPPLDSYLPVILPRWAIIYYFSTPVKYNYWRVATKMFYSMGYCVPRYTYYRGRYYGTVSNLAGKIFLYRVLLLLVRAYNAPRYMLSVIDVNSEYLLSLGLRFGARRKWRK